MDFSVAIPTFNRPNEVGDCLESILIQTFIPQELLVIDDGALPSKFIQRWLDKLKKKNINFVYYKKDHAKIRRGLSESKNIALKIARHDIVFILDDDLVLDPDFFEKIMDIWAASKDDQLIGVGGVIKNSRVKPWSELLFNKIFGLTSKYKWDINDVGFQVWDEHMPKAEKGFYLHGGASSYSKQLAQKLGFTTFSGGRTGLEDVEHCLRAKNAGYYFIVEPRAKVLHKGSNRSKESELQIGVKEGYNRKIIFQNDCKKTLKNYVWFVWANVGWVLRLFLTGWFMRGLGMLRGLLTAK